MHLPRMFTYRLDFGVALMSIGERAQITIPTHLAYGPNGFPGRVPANANLLFDIELMKISRRN